MLDQKNWQNKVQNGRERDRKQKEMFWLIFYLIIFSLWIYDASQDFYPTLRMKNALKNYFSTITSQKKTCLSSESSKGLPVLQQPINANLAFSWGTGERMSPSSASPHLLSTSLPAISGRTPQGPHCQLLFLLPKKTLSLGSASLLRFGTHFR